MNGVEVSYVKEDLRPAFVLDDVRGAEFHRVKAGRAQGVPTFSLVNVERFVTEHCWPVPDSRLNRVTQQKF